MPAGPADDHDREQLLNLGEKEVLSDPLFEQGILCVDLCAGAERALPPGTADAHDREEQLSAFEEEVQADHLFEQGIRCVISVRALSVFSCRSSASRGSAQPF